MQNSAIRWQISMSIKVTIYIFALALTVSEILMCKMFDLENLDPCYRVQHLPLWMPISVKVIACFFMLALTISGVWPWKFSSDVMECNIRNGLTRWWISTSIKVTIEHYSIALTIFQILAFQIVNPWKCRSTAFAIEPFDSKYMSSYSMVMYALSLTIY